MLLQWQMLFGKNIKGIEFLEVSNNYMAGVFYYQVRNFEFQNLKRIGIYFYARLINGVSLSKLQKNVITSFQVNRLGQARLGQNRIKQFYRFFRVRNYLVIYYLFLQVLLYSRNSFQSQKHNICVDIFFSCYPALVEEFLFQSRNSFFIFQYWVFASFQFGGYKQLSQLQKHVYTYFKNMKCLVVGYIFMVDVKDCLYSVWVFASFQFVGYKQLSQVQKHVYIYFENMKCLVVGQNFFG
eukprot:TRINITY_DN15321_c0_g1_i8.p2 TRINITY_DN15321_c0_g1~~TRINITY_DN15321_c0_g1_i8.p2  ORF type:complete len:239 (-),score=-7.61 TRINITY_DN15321_c0_g1_i8:353-1069(-)